MNAERLGLILSAVREDLDKSSLVEKLEGVIEALSTYIGAPNELNQSRITSARNALDRAIQNSSFSKFPCTWRSTLEELGIYAVMGQALSKTIEEVFEKNRITADKARKEIQSIHESLEQFDEAAAHILEGFDYFQIETVPPAEGEAELSIMIPSAAFEGRLKSFAAEVEFFDQAIGYFSELATGERAEPLIKQMSSSDPTLLVKLKMPALYLVLWATKEILDLIIKTSDLRNARSIAEKAGAEDRITKMIEVQIQDEIEKGLSGVADTMIERYTEVGPSRSVFRTEGEKILSGLATRLDNGYQLEGDVGEVEDQIVEDGQEPDDAHAELVENAGKVQELAHEIRYAVVPDQPVLELAKIHAGAEKNNLANPLRDDSSGEPRLLPSISSLYVPDQNANN